MLFVRGIAFFTLFVGVVVLSHWYLGRRLVADAGAVAPLSTLGWAVIWGGFGSIIVGFISGRVLPKRAAAVLQWVGFGWMGTFGVALVTTLAAELVTALARLSGADVSGWGPGRAAVILGVTVPAMVVGLVLARLPETTRVEVPIEGLDPRLDGFRIVQLSDVHLGETLGRRFALWLVAKVNALNADAVVLTGDIIEGSVGSLHAEVSPLRELRARHGVFYVTGNHEYYHGAAEWELEMRRMGMTVLHNDHRVVEVNGAQLVVAGVPDVEGAHFSSDHRPSIAKALEGAPKTAPRVLLAHQPRFARQVGGHRVDLMLSGHTHGGQIFPFMVFVKLQQPVIKGMHVIEGVRTYTSRGTGYWGPPFRIGARGEVTELVLRRV